MPIALDPNCLGLVVSGDVADMTIYTDRYGRKIMYPASPPRVAPSLFQLHQHERFRRAMFAWRFLSKDDRRQYALACTRLRLPCTATSLWVCFSCRQDPDLFFTICRQSGLDLFPPPPVD